MYKKDEVIAHLDNFITYATSADHTALDADQLQILIEPLYDAITDFYALPLTSRISRNIEALTHAMIRACDIDAGILGGTDGFDYIADRFNEVPKAFMDTPVETLAESVYEYTDEETLLTSYKSDLLEQFAVQFASACDELPVYLDSLAEKANAAFLPNPLQMLFASPITLGKPDKEAIAGIIYVDCGYLDIIEAYSLSVFVPPSVYEWRRRHDEATANFC